MSSKSYDQYVRRLARDLGFKLVKSRTRKPYVCDFQKYGIVDADEFLVFGWDDDDRQMATLNDCEHWLWLVAEQEHHWK